MKIELGGKYGSAAGRFAIVDDEDFQRVNSISWCAHRSGGGRRYIYAVGHPCPKGRQVKLHRWLLSVPKGMEVDHINGDTLDNRRANLRIVTTSQNQMNRVKLPSNNKSGALGVRQRSPIQWEAQLRVNGKAHYLGTFPTKEEAAKAYAEAKRNLV